MLDVGTGSGYQAAVLAELAREVHSLERIPELAARAQASLDRAGYGGRVRVHVADGTQGLPQKAPFGGIAVAAAASNPPPALLEQLELGRATRHAGRALGRLQENLENLLVGEPTGMTSRRPSSSCSRAPAAARAPRPRPRFGERRVLRAAPGCRRRRGRAPARRSPPRSRAPAHARRAPEPARSSGPRRASSASTAA